MTSTPPHKRPRVTSTGTEIDESPVPTSAPASTSSAPVGVGMPICDANSPSVCLSAAAQAAGDVSLNIGERAFNNTQKLREFWQRFHERLEAAAPSAPPAAATGGFGAVLRLPCCRRPDGCVRDYAFKLTRDDLSSEFPKNTSILFGDVDLRKYCITQATPPHSFRNGSAGLYPFANPGDLMDLLQKQRSVDHMVATNIALNLLHGVAWLHSHDVARRDIKPENIALVVDPDTHAVTAKMIDFGLAKRPYENMGFCGSFAYYSTRMAQAYAEGKQVQDPGMWFGNDFAGAALAVLMLWDRNYAEWSIGTMPHLVHGMYNSTGKEQFKRAKLTEALKFRYLRAETPSSVQTSSSKNFADALIACLQDNNPQNTTLAIGRLPPTSVVGYVVSGGIETSGNLAKNWDFRTPQYDRKQARRENNLNPRALTM